jgi:hypothetical protein
MYEANDSKTFKLRQISKSLYIIESETGCQLTTPHVHDTLQEALNWANAWASSWPNTKIVYES